MNLIELFEKAPPGKKAEHFVRKNKTAFKQRYGKDWARYLYGTAWKQFGESREWLDAADPEDEPELDESGAGLSRIAQHIMAGTPFIAISAMRADADRSTNIRHTQHLRHWLHGMPVSFIETAGEYQEVGQDRPRRERSFFIMPRGRFGQLGLNQFRQVGERLMRKYHQDAMLFGDGERVHLVWRDGGAEDLGNVLTFDPARIGQLGGFSVLKRRKFAFTTPDQAPHGVTYGAAKPAAERPGLAA